MRNTYFLLFILFEFPLRVAISFRNPTTNCILRVKLYPFLFLPSPFSLSSLSASEIYRPLFISSQAKLLSTLFFVFYISLEAKPPHFRTSPYSFLFYLLYATHVVMITSRQIYPTTTQGLIPNFSYPISFFVSFFFFFLFDYTFPSSYFLNSKELFLPP